MHSNLIKFWLFGSAEVVYIYIVIRLVYIYLVITISASFSWFIAVRYMHSNLVKFWLFGSAEVVYKRIHAERKALFLHCTTGSGREISEHGSVRGLDMNARCKSTAGVVDF